MTTFGRVDISQHNRKRSSIAEMASWINRSISAVNYDIISFGS